VGLKGTTDVLSLKDLEEGNVVRMSRLLQLVALSAPYSLLYTWHAYLFSRTSHLGGLRFPFHIGRHYHFANVMRILLPEIHRLKTFQYCLVCRDIEW
jgi:hypothetical protein